MNGALLDHMVSLKITSPFDLKEGLRRRAKQRRLEANLSQAGLAERANVSLGSLKRFEATGNASVDFVIAIAFAMGAEHEFEALFPPRPVRKLEDVIGGNRRLRGRGR